MMRNVVAVKDGEKQHLGKWPSRRGQSALTLAFEEHDVDPDEYDYFETYSEEDTDVKDAETAEILADPDEDIYGDNYIEFLVVLETKHHGDVVQKITAPFSAEAVRKSWSRNRGYDYEATKCYVAPMSLVEELGGNAVPEDEDDE